MQYLLPYSDTIFLGIIRLFLWFIFLYVIKRLFFKDEASQNQVKTIVYSYAYYGSFLVVGIFILVQLSSYDLLTCLLIIIGLFLAKALKISSSMTRKEWVRTKKMMLLRVIENVEDNDPIIDINQEEPEKQFVINDELIAILLVSIIAIAVRFYLIRFDTFQLSPSWFTELSLVKSVSLQRWINEDMILTGQYALMSFYSLMTGISSEIALESFGILQSLLICFIVFWFMSQVTTSQITIPLISSLIFALFFNLAPVNLNQLTHAKQTWTALTFALPALIFISKPWLLYKRKVGFYFLGMFMIFLAIGLIDLFVLLILIPPFFLVQLIFVNKKHFHFYWKSLGAFVLGAFIILSYYATVCQLLDLDFGLFLRTNFISVTTVSSTSNMIIGYEPLLKSIQALSVVVIGIMIFLHRQNPKKWKAPLSFLIYINVLILITLTGYTYFDQDLFSEVLPILLSCAIGLLIHLGFYFFNKSLTRFEIRDIISVPLIILISLVIAYHSQPKLMDRAATSKKINTDIISAYEKLDSDYLPYSYAVINANELFPLSVNSHQFISYDEFINDYPLRDSLFFANKENLKFLKENPEIIVPNSLLIFVYDNPVSDYITINNEQVAIVENRIKDLENLGRKKREVYAAIGFKVFEIINNPGLSKINEML